VANTLITLIGIDYGERRIGVAVSDGGVAVPLAIVEHQDRASDLARVAKIAREKRAECVIVGLPLLESGEEGDQARRCRRFGDALARRLDAPVVYHDESFSSVEAEAHVATCAAPARVGTKRGQKRGIDDLAAAVILQSYIDARRRE
jgi:putative Holliday junction resolvase